MRSVVTVTVSLLAFLFAICSVHAYVYFVEAENFDTANSAPVAGGGTWSIEQDGDAFNGNYLLYSGPHAGAVTSLLYPIPNVTDDAGDWTAWIRCVMPDGGSDSYFLYISNDGGSSWGPQQTAHGSGQGPDWRWESWTLNTPLTKGDGNVLKIAERENSQVDVVCVRNDGGTPTDEEYERWQEQQKDISAAVEPLYRITTTWGKTKSTY